MNDDRQQARRPGPARLTLGELHIEGHSRAGDSTWLRIHPPGLAVDVGRGSRILGGARDVFISHGHLDHALGLPFVLSHRTRHHGAATRVFCPREIAEAIEELVAAASRLEGVEYRWQLEGLAPGDRVEVSRELVIEAFATDHVVPALGFHLRRRRQRLQASYAGLPGSELGALRRRGVEIDERWEEAWMSYCGDTAATVLDREPELLEAPVLLLECTFLRPEHRERAARFGHLHFDDLLERRDRLRNQALVLHHLSWRHSLGELRRRVDEELPEHAGRVHVFGEQRA